MNTERLPQVLVVNPGSTSTRIALFQGEELLRGDTLPVTHEGKPPDLWDEFPTRLEGVRQWFVDGGGALAELDAVVGRGGLLRPVEGGVYLVSEAMLADARGSRQGSHASNLGCALARALADEATRELEVHPGRASDSGEGRKNQVPAFIVDPVSTDEFHDLARFSGLEEIPRRSLSHALSIHALVHQVCEEDGRAVSGSRFVVGHLGGGISICPVADGFILDANNANSGGPFSPTRAGGLPTQELMALCFSQRFSLQDLREMTTKRGGLLSYLGTDDALEVEARIQDGDEGALMVYQAMAYQISKEIGAMATVMDGGPEKILLTGGLAASDRLTGWIRERVDFLAPVEVHPEIGEMRALAQGALRVLRGEDRAKEY